MTILGVAKTDHARRAPFLCWPVARREYFFTLILALTPAFAWSIMIFGWRALNVLIAALFGAAIVHVPLQRLTKRGQYLLTAHTLTSALLLVALSDPMWPAYLVGIAAGFATFLIWLEGGPGHERVHAWALLLVLLAAVAVPWHIRRTHASLPPTAIVARDRLLMGDIRHAAPPVTTGWPKSVEINGHDAYQMPRPSVVIQQFWQDIASVPEYTMDAQAQRARVESIFNTTLAFKLPAIESLMYGVSTGPLGATNAILIVLGGLFLAYRNILRTRSFLIFMTSLLAGFVGTSLYAGATQDLVSFGFRGLWQDHLTEMVALIFYQLLSSDVLFASVFVLAMPGTEPVTPRARRLYLILAGLTAAILYRMNLPFPPTATTLAAFSVVSPIFDSVFAQRSWLNRSQRW